MIKTSSLFITALLGLCLHVAPAQAQLARTFVSSLGSDANDCNRFTPCRTFQVAHNKTLANGEITVLDPGGYGAVTITKSISIINDGVGEAGLLVSGGAVGILINGGSSDAISLRGLTVKGIGFGGGLGIRFNSGKSLSIENCVIRNLTDSFAAIALTPTGSSSFAMSNTVVADNSSTGIEFAPSGTGAVKAVFSRVELHNNGGNGLRVFGSAGVGPIDVTVVDSVADNNSAAGGGFFAQSQGPAVRLMLIRSVASNNNIGLQAFGTGATLRVGQSTVTGNTTGWLAASGGVIQSYNDNNIDGNTGGDPAPPTILKK